MATATTTCTRSFLIVGLLTAHEPDHGYQLGARITTGVVWSAGLSFGRAKPADMYLGCVRRNTKGRTEAL
jgi:hypothetical protein